MSKWNGNYENNGRKYINNNCMKNQFKTSLKNNAKSAGTQFVSNMLTDLAKLLFTKGK